MYIIVTTSLIAFTLSLIMMTMASLISKKTFSDREKSSPFECGFDPKGSARMPFSMQFFLIAMIFLIFDVEITLLLPLIISMKITNMINFTMVTTAFLTILLLGLYHEWNQGILKWAN